MVVFITSNVVIDNKMVLMISVFKIHGLNRNYGMIVQMRSKKRYAWRFHRRFYGRFQ